VVDVRNNHTTSTSFGECQSGCFADACCALQRLSVSYRSFDDGVMLTPVIRATPSTEALTGMVTVSLWICAITLLKIRLRNAKRSWNETRSQICKIIVGEKDPKTQATLGSLA
jgi:hypothetical protein